MAFLREPGKLLVFNDTRIIGHHDISVRLKNKYKSDDPILSGGASIIWDPNARDLIVLNGSESQDAVDNLVIERIKDQLAQSFGAVTARVVEFRSLRSG